MLKFGYILSTICAGRMFLNGFIITAVPFCSLSIPRDPSDSIPAAMKGIRFLRDDVTLKTDFVVLFPTKQ